MKLAANDLFIEIKMIKFVVLSGPLQILLGAKPIQQCFHFHISSTSSQDSGCYKVKSSPSRSLDAPMVLFIEVESPLAWF